MCAEGGLSWAFSDIHKSFGFAFRIILVRSFLQMGRMDLAIVNWAVGCTASKPDTQVSHSLEWRLSNHFGQFSCDPLCAS